jgi:hypothetical protein
MKRNMLSEKITENGLTQISSLEMPIKRFYKKSYQSKKYLNLVKDERL